MRIIDKNDKWLIVKEGNILRNFHYEFDIKGLYKLRDSDETSVIYNRNKFGLRDDCSTTSNIDMLTIGGSTTDQRYVKLEDTFQKVLEERISEYIGRKVCVSNAGVDGHSSMEYSFHLKIGFHLFPI